MRLAITGTPGVGKHTVARIVADRLGMRLVDINEVAMSSAIIAMDESTYIVDTDRLEDIFRGVEDNVLLVGHLAPYVLDGDKVDLAVVLRRSPYELREVYRQRGYGEDKAKDNLQSEILGIITHDAVKRFGDHKVVEVDCTGRSVGDVADEIIRIARHEQDGMLGHVDWLAIVVQRDELREFFDY
ncbi:MAG: AAA family ATPase [Candidatus Nitrosocaldus sp.]|nr:AAA family ATPase [Candidatus Nitrosocaldus sp.]MCS7141720.1 AAA family ATPase [Candidatus Nitrosocaldus sp.]MDW8000800.1 AAA family ATPase [Candidatus Nitrosocaldus sp.]